MTESDEHIRLARALRELRHRAQMTQVEVAEIVGVRNTYISQVETGARSLSVRTLLGLLAAYDASLAELAELMAR